MSTIRGEVHRSVQEAQRVGASWSPEYRGEAEFPETPGLKCTADLDHALDQAERQRKLVLVDVVALTDSNSAMVHHQVFPLPEVTAALKPYVLVTLYTDAIPSHLYRAPPPDVERERAGRVNWDGVVQTFHTSQTPYYAILKPTGPGQFETLAVYDLYPHRDWQKFAAWLREYGLDAVPR